MEEDERAAAIRYHGKTKPPEPTHYMAEFEAVVTWTGGTGLVPPSAYRLENVTGKLWSAGQDILSYRVAFIEEKDFLPLSAQVHVRVAPLTKVRRRNGRPEVGLMAGPFKEVLALPVADRPAFIHEIAYDIVLDASKTKIAAIYFEIEDCDTTPLPPDAERNMSHAVTSGGPMWRLGVAASTLLQQATAGNDVTWVALPPLHPDPAVDPGVPIQRRQQRKPRWYWYKSQGPHQLGGKLSGTKWYKLLGQFPDDWDRDAKEVFRGNPLTRSGRMLESPVALCYMLSPHHVKGTRLMECGSFPHPTLEDVMATPDAIIVLPKDKPKTLPAWCKSTYTEEQLVNMDLTRGIWECKTKKKKDKKGVGASFKPEYLAQLYAEMICAGLYWAELACYCEETGEIRIYSVFRKADISDKFNAVVKRMRNELIAGTPFKTACKHPTNVELVRECAASAAYFNKEGMTPPRYRTCEWKTAAVKEFEALCTRYDTVSYYPDDPEGKTVAASNASALVAEESSVIAANGKKKRGRSSKKNGKAPTAAAKPQRKKRDTVPDLDEDPRDNVESVALSLANSHIPERWDDIIKACAPIADAISTGRIDGDFDRMLEMQVVRLTRLMKDAIVYQCSQDLKRERGVELVGRHLSEDPLDAIPMDEEEEEEEEEEEPVAIECEN